MANGHTAPRPSRLLSVTIAFSEHDHLLRLLISVVLGPFIVVPFSLIATEKGEVKAHACVKRLLTTTDLSSAAK
jgi:hypothetical protein